MPVPAAAVALDTIQTIPTINELGKLQVKEKLPREKDLERHGEEKEVFLLFISLPPPHFPRYNFMCNCLVSLFFPETFTEMD